MTGEPPRDGERPSRLFFDDLPDEPDGVPARPTPVATTPSASARRRRDNEDSLVDTGPMEPIREPIAEPARAGRQLYFDDLGDIPDEPPGPEEQRKPVALGGTRLVDVRRSRHLPIGAVLAVLGVLVLVAVIAAFDGGGGRSGRTSAAGSTGHATQARHSADRTGAPEHSPAAPPPAQQHSTRPSASSTPSHRASKPAATAEPPIGVLKRQPLTVLNNTTIQGLAQRAASTFSARGWKVGGIGNYTGRIASTTVYYDAGNRTEQQAAAALAGQFAGVMHTAPRFAGLPGSGLTVVLAPDWSA